MWRRGCFSRTHRVVTLSISTRIIGAPVSQMRSTQKQCKMADFVDVSTRQGVVNEYLTAEATRLIQIKRRLRSSYGEDATDVNWVRRCVCRFKSGEKDSGGRLRKGRPTTAATKETREKFNTLIRSDHPFTSSEQFAAVTTGRTAVLPIDRELG